MSYIQGRGVPSNFERGIYWLERAAEKGYLEAIYKVGEAWVDHKKNGNAIAYIWMFIAGNLGHKDASHRRDEIAGVIGIDSVVGLLPKYCKANGEEDRGKESRQALDYQSSQ